MIGCSLPWKPSICASEDIVGNVFVRVRVRETEQKKMNEKEMRNMCDI